MDNSQYSNNRFALKHLQILIWEENASITLKKKQKKKPITWATVLVVKYFKSGIVSGIPVWKCIRGKKLI